jgi:type II secretory pathway pseudopilin PulG
MTPDIADILAGELKVSRGTAYDMMREALKEASPVQEPAGRVVSSSCSGYAVIKWSKQTSPKGGGAPRNAWSWPIRGDAVYLTPTPQPAPAQESVAWRFTGIAGFKRFVTDAQHKAFSPEAQAFYEPFKCASCITTARRLNRPQLTPQKREDGMPASSEERYLRRLLAARAGMPHTYFDDGEAQGQQLGVSIDFMRETAASIDAKLQALNHAKLVEAKASTSTTSVSGYDGGPEHEDGPDEEGFSGPRPRNSFTKEQP